MRLRNLHLDARVRRKIATKHGLTPDEVERAFREPDRQVIRRDRLLVRGRDDVSGKYVMIIGDDRNGVLYAATCRLMTDRERASYRKACDRRRG